MSIECYYKHCTHHSANSGPDMGPICDLYECVASKEQLVLFAQQRQKELQQIIHFREKNSVL